MGGSIRFRSSRLGVREKVAQFKPIAETTSSKSQPAKHLMSTRPGQISEAEAVFALKHARTFSFQQGQVAVFQ